MVLENFEKIFLHIHGATTFSSYDLYIDYLNKFSLDFEDRKKWIDWLKFNVKRNIKILRPTMPNKQNAKFFEWKIVFDNIIDQLLKDASSNNYNLQEKLIIEGYSLGASFLAKYFSNISLDKKFKLLILIAAPFSNSLAYKSGEELTNGFEFYEFSNLDKLAKNFEKIIFIYSKNDFIVPLSEMDKYKEKLSSYENVEFLVLDKEAHFFNYEFPELLEIINSIH